MASKSKRRKTTSEKANREQINIRLKPGDRAKFQAAAAEAQRKEADWARITLLAACAK